MLDLTAAFTLQNNPEFSCEPGPVETKSKALFMVGKETRIRKTVDAWVKHGSFISRSLEVSDSSAFAAPTQVPDMYGAIPWNSKPAHQFTSCCNTW